MNVKLVHGFGNVCGYLLWSVIAIVLPSCEPDARMSVPAVEHSRPRLAEVYRVWPFDSREAVRRQDETAKALGVPKELTLDLDGNVGVKLVLIPPGKFLMGSPLSEQESEKREANLIWFPMKDWFYDESPQHEVTISRPFYMGMYSVTLRQFTAFADSAGYRSLEEDRGIGYVWDGREEMHDANGGSWRRPGFQQTEDHPVSKMTYYDAATFCEWLTKKSGRKVTLPTEAQWEYACRAGTATAYYWGQDAKDGNTWCNGGRSHGFTAPVGSFGVNSFGLYDMQGNVWHWCSDWYDIDYYTRGENLDPRGPVSGKYRVLRGGSWKPFPSPQTCRSAYRYMDYPDGRASINDGFRIVVDCPDQVR